MMRDYVLISTLALAIIGWPASGHAQQQGANTSGQSEVAGWEKVAGTDRLLPPQEKASAPPPAGWGACPRCMGAKDVQAAWEQTKTRPHNPRDLTGVWGGGWSPGGSLPNLGNPPPYTPWGEARAKAASPDTSGGGALSQVNCDPMGWPRLHLNNYGFEFVTLPDRVIQFFERTGAKRIIWTDGRKLPDVPPQLNWMGWAVGRWEGDTFIVESNGYEDRSLLGNRPHSDEMRIVERWRRPELGLLEVDMTIIDAKTYTAPWVTPRARINMMPRAELWEDFCVPSDYQEFNSKIYEPISGRPQ